MSIEDIQNLKKIREIKTQYGLSPKRRLKVEKNILKKLNHPEETLIKRLGGLEMEDEFLLLLLLVAEVEQINKLEQKQLVNDKKYTVPDFILSVILSKEFGETKVPLAQRMLVEVKKCKNEKFDFFITKKEYQKLRYYSELYTLPLYFAIKFDTKLIKQWFFISGKIIEKFGTNEMRRVHNRDQEGYMLTIGEILKKDLSSLWLNNHIALLPKGTIIEKKYDKSIKEANMIDKLFGALMTHTISYKNNQIHKDLNKKNSFMDAAIFSIILETLARGKSRKTKEGDTTTLEFESDNNYFIPYYHIMIETFLHLRKQFKKQLNETDDSVEYYLNTFSDFDRNLITYIRNEYYSLVDTGILVPVRMLPNLKSK